MSIEWLRDQARSIVGEPADIPFTDRMVAIVEARDGSVLDVVYQVAKRESIVWNSQEDEA